MKALWAVIITIAGFLVGMVLAGGGGFFAEALYSKKTPEESKKLETYWAETGLSFIEVGQLISNEKCYSSRRYYEACVGAVSESVLPFQRQLSVQTGLLTDLSYVENLDEKNERELLAIYSGMTTEVDFEKLLATIQTFEVDESKKSQQAATLINSFLSIYIDPHTYIMPLNYYDEVGSRMERSKYFIGISYEKVNGEFRVRKVVKDSDADRAGLRADDILTGINAVSLKQRHYQDVSNILRDESVSEFRIDAVRNGQPLAIVMKRSFKRLSYFQYETIEAAGQTYAVMSLSKFSRGACVQIADAIRRAREERVAGIVLDLRDNPGGQLDEAACMAGLFLGPDKKAYYIEYFDESKANEIALTSEEQLYAGPLTVLVNSSSASSAELLAGALQDYRRALIIGERTFGKGTFQESEDWDLNAKVSLFRTQGLYLLPSRNSTQVVGIRPDVELIEDNEKNREGNIYFNPVKLQTRIYHGLRDTEKVQNFVYKKCALEVNTSDSYIETGLQYLSCARPVVNLAQDYNPDPN